MQNLDLPPIREIRMGDKVDDLLATQHPLYFIIAWAVVVGYLCCSGLRAAWRWVVAGYWHIRERRDFRKGTP